MQLTSACECIFGLLRQDLDPNYTYHNLQHTLNVCESVHLLCAYEKISPPDSTLLQTAAAFHDSGFLIGHKDHEKHSCTMAREILPDFGYTPSQIDLVCSLIMSTAHGHVPSTILEMIMRDADVDYLGTDNYAKYSEALRRELIYTGQIGSGDEEWNQLQVRYLSHHRYYTSTSLRLREPYKQKTLTLLLNSI